MGFENTTELINKTELINEVTDWNLVLNISVPIFSIIIFVIVLFVLYRVDDPGLKEEKEYNEVKTCDPDDVENTLPKNVLLKLKKLAASNNTNSVTDHNTEGNHATVTSLPPVHTENDKSRRRTYSDTASNENQHRRKRTDSETQRYLEGMLRRPSSTRLVPPLRVRSKSTSDTVTKRNTDGVFIIEEEEDVLITSPGGDRRQSETTAAANIRKNNITIS